MPINPDCRGFDIGPSFNCRVEGSFHQQMASCKAAGVPVVVSPIWISPGPCPLGQPRQHSGADPSGSSKGKPLLKPLLEQLRKREMVVQLEHGPVNAEGNGDSCWPLNREKIASAAEEADGLLPNSWLELQALRSDLQWDGDCFEIAHYGVDPSVSGCRSRTLSQTHGRSRTIRDAGRAD